MLVKYSYITLGYLKSSCIPLNFRSTGRAPDGEALDVDIDDPDRAIDVDTNK